MTIRARLHDIFTRLAELQTDPCLVEDFNSGGCGIVTYQDGRAEVDFGPLAPDRSAHEKLQIRKREQQAREAFADLAGLLRQIPLFDHPRLRFIMFLEGGVSGSPVRARFALEGVRFEASGLEHAESRLAGIIRDLSGLPAEGTFHAWSVMNLTVRAPSAGTAWVKAGTLKYEDFLFCGQIVAEEPEVSLQIESGEVLAEVGRLGLHVQRRRNTRGGTAPDTEDQVAEPSA